MSEKDYVAQIMDEWYSSMATNNVSVQPKASTLLGTILAKYDVKPKENIQNIWDEFLSMPSNRFSSWYDSLSEVQKKDFDSQRQKIAVERKRTTLEHSKTLLKG